MKKLAAVILAAGLGTRMKSGMAKVLHPILGRPMLSWPLSAVKPLKPSVISVVVGHQGDKVEAAFSSERGLVFATQKQMLGTADAFKTGLEPIRGFDGIILVINGDMPLTRTETLKNFIAAHRKSKNALTVGTFITDTPGSYGRIIRDGSRILGIVEKKDATPQQLAITEVNGGIYVIEPEVLPLLERITNSNAAGEYYLTDMVGLAVAAGMKVGGYVVDEEDLFGVNSRRELAGAADILRRRMLNDLMDSGVTVMHPESAFIQPGISVGRDTVIYPNVVIEGASSIGEGCVIYPGVRLVDAVIGDRVKVKDSTLIEESTVGDGCAVGPFAHIRPGTVLKKDVKVGNFVELKKAVLEDGAKASHLSYLGDAQIGRNVNIGAGTITCNYDGKKKHKTTIGEGVFIGSDTQLVAPVTIGDGAYVGAGSTITADVPPGALAISRVRQRNITDWALRKAQMADCVSKKAQKADSGSK